MPWEKVPYTALPGDEPPVVAYKFQGDPRNVRLFYYRHGGDNQRAIVIVGEHGRRGYSCKDVALEKLGQHLEKLGIGESWPLPVPEFKR